MTESFIDSEGYEVPAEYLPLATDAELAQAFTLSEYNRYLNMTPTLAEEYKALLFKRNLLKSEVAK